jgi:RNA polymerase sigma-70 factor (ECF subfamily)
MPSAAVALQRKAYDTPQELELIRRAKQKDEAAFNALYALHHNRVFVVIRNIVKDEDTAEWLANAAMSKVWQKLRQFGEDSKFSTWITRIAINEGLMHVRRNKSRQHDSSFEAMVESGRVDDKHVAVRDLDLAGIADRQMLDSAIGRVPAQFREVLRLRYWEGMSMGEIHRHREFSKCSMSSLKSRLHRGRKSLVYQVHKLSSKLDIPPVPDVY